jgi:uncharacterized membrane protein AbrB (regulator of aidB expression)
MVARTRRVTLPPLWLLAVAVASVAVGSLLGSWLLRPEVHPYMHQHMVIFLSIAVIALGGGVAILLTARRWL